MSDPPPTLVLVRDLLFVSRIGTAARAAGVETINLRDPNSLQNHPGRRLIIDLNQPGALDAAVEWKRQTPPQSPREVIGFVSHVDADTIARARAAGIDQVLPRSRFVEVLPDLLA